MAATSGGRAALGALADELSAIMSKNELERLGELFTPDAVFWNNLTGTEVLRDERMATASLEQQIFASFTWVDVRTEFFDGGFVQQARVQGSTVDGDAFDFPICLVVRGEGDKLTRFEEYVNITPVQPILDAMARHAGAPAES